MDLDAGINAVLERVEKTGSLDVQDEYFLKYFDIYSDINSLKRRIVKSGHKHVTHTYFENKEKFIDIRKFLKISNLYDFMECVFIEIFSRACEQGVMVDIIKRLENNELSKEEYLETVESSIEAKEKDIKFTGYSKFNVNAFNNLSSKDFVRIAFIRLLEREADDFGLKDFTLKLKLGELTRNEVIRRIVHSNEAQGKNLPKIIYSGDENNQKKKIFNRHPFNKHELEFISQDYDEMDNLEKCYKDAKNEIKKMHQRSDELLGMVNWLSGRLELAFYMLSTKEEYKKN